MESLKIVSATFVLVYFASLKRLKQRKKETKKKCFLLHFKNSFCSWHNQVLVFQIFKCHDVIVYLSMKHEAHMCFICILLNNLGCKHSFPLVDFIHTKRIHHKLKNKIQTNSTFEKRKIEQIENIAKICQVVQTNMNPQCQSIEILTYSLKATWLLKLRHYLQNKSRFCLPDSHKLTVCFVYNNYVQIKREEHLLIHS